METTMTVSEMCASIKGLIREDKTLGFEPTTENLELARKIGCKEYLTFRERATVIAPLSIAKHGTDDKESQEYLQTLISFMHHYNERTGN